MANWQSSSGSRNGCTDATFGAWSLPKMKKDGYKMKNGMVTHTAI